MSAIVGPKSVFGLYFEPNSLTVDLEGRLEDGEGDVVVDEEGAVPLVDDQVGRRLDLLGGLLLADVVGAGGDLDALGAVQAVGRGQDHVGGCRKEKWDSLHFALGVMR